ncbi:MAG TPA: hypothetical protein VF752_04930 [Thermoleophilaceae bacterium]
MRFLACLAGILAALAVVAVHPADAKTAPDGVPCGKPQPLPQIGSGPTRSGGHFELYAGYGHRTDVCGRHCVADGLFDAKGEFVTGDNACGVTLRGRKLNVAVEPDCERLDFLYWGPISPEVARVVITLRDGRVLEARIFAGPTGWAMNFYGIALRDRSPPARIEARDAAGRIVALLEYPFGDLGLCSLRLRPLSAVHPLAAARGPTGRLIRATGYRAQAHLGRRAARVLCVWVSGESTHRDLETVPSFCTPRRPSSRYLSGVWGSACSDHDAMSAGLTSTRVRRVRLEYGDGATVTVDTRRIPAALGTNSRFWLAVAHSQEVPVRVAAYAARGRLLASRKSDFPFRLNCRRGNRSDEAAGLVIARATLR